VPAPIPGSTQPSAQRWVQLGGLAFLVGVVLVIVRPFLIPAAWAAILASATWPVFGALERRLGGRTAWAAVLTTLLVILVVVAPTVLISISLVLEVEDAVGAVRAWAEGADLAVPGWVSRIPWIGPYLAERADRLIADPAIVRDWAAANVGPWARNLAAAAGNLGRLVGNAVITLVTLFFLYRHGRTLMAQIGAIASRLAGERIHAMLGPLGESVQAVMYGMVFTALAQGGLGMIGYWAAGFGAPVLLGALTALASILPFGAPIVYGPAVIWLLLQGRPLVAIALLVWGAVVISSADNVIRSWFISGATRVPFLLVFFGVLGGVAAFGMIGLFLGPIAIAVLLGLWREWATDQA
jgi:predicted PurR-regulated permease PerM